MLIDHLRELPRLEAAERRTSQSALIYSNGRQLSDSDRRSYERDLDLALQGGQRRKRAPKITPHMAERMGIRLASDAEKEEVKGNT